MQVDKMPVNEIVFDKMQVDKMPVDEIPFDEIVFDEMTRSLKSCPPRAFDMKPVVRDTLTSGTSI
jgi:hypothetical protein